MAATVEVSIRDELLTRAELAQQLESTPRTLSRWEAASQGPPKIVIGRKVFYRKKAVLEWLAAKENPATPRRGRPRGSISCSRVRTVYQRLVANSEQQPADNSPVTRRLPQSVEATLRKA